MEVSASDPEGLSQRHDFVVKLARRLLWDSSGSEDLAQEAWLAACRNGTAESASRGWFTGVLRRLAARDLRSKERRQRRENHSISHNRLPSVEDIEEREEIRRRLMRSILALPELYRTPILLRYYEDRPPRTIARQLGMPTETVRTRIRRGLEILGSNIGRERPSSQPSAGAWILGIAGWNPTPWSWLVLKSPWMLGALAMKTGTKLWVAGAAVLLGGVLAWPWWQSLTVDPGAAPPIEKAPPPVTGSLHRPAELTPGSSLPPPPARPIESRPFEGDVPAADATERCRLQLEVVWARSGKPAALTPVSFLMWGQNDPFLNSRSVRTDEAGVITLEDLPVGAITISPLLGGHRVVRLAPGERKRERIEIPRAARIFGVVVDEAGAAVPDADIWLNEVNGDTEGQFVTQSDVAGRFTIEEADTGTWRYVGARKSLRTPTPLVSCSGAADSVHEVRLVFPGPGGNIVGRVVDIDRRPVPMARVIIGNRGGDQGLVAPGTRGASAGPEMIVADSDGAFASRGFAEGRLPYVARAPGFAAARGEVVAAHGVTTTVEIVLTRGGEIRGVVNDAAGRPIERVSVTIGDYGSLQGSLVRTDARGRFHAEGIAAGTHSASFESREHGDKSVEIVVRDSEVTAIEVVMTKGQSIHGRIVDEAGKPIEGLYVAAEHYAEKVTSFLHAKSDHRGAFELKNALPVPYHVKILPPNGGAFVLAERKRVEVSNEPLEFVVTRLSTKLGGIRGRIVDRHGSPIGHAQVATRKVGANTSPIDHVEATTGKFSIDQLPPGKYFLSADAQGFAGSGHEPVEVRSEEIAEVGDIALERGGILEVEVECEPGVDAAVLSMTVMPRGGRHSRESLILEGTVGRASGIPVGPALLELGGQGIADTEAEVAITAETTTKAKLIARPGVERVVELIEPPGTEAASAEWTLTNVEGRTILSGSTHRYEGKLHGIRLSLPRGRFHLRGALSSGQATTATFEILNLEPSPTSIQLRF